MKQKTVEQLRKDGYKVRVEHFRPDANTGKPVRYSRRIKDKDVAPTGGFTNVTITSPDGKDFEGSSYCHNNDVFNYGLAVTISIGRAFKFGPVQ